MRVSPASSRVRRRRRATSAFRRALAGEVMISSDMTRTACQHHVVQQNADMTSSDLTANAGYERFTVKQRITMMVNRYEIRSVDASGFQGEAADGPVCDL